MNFVTNLKLKKTCYTQAAGIVFPKAYFKETKNTQVTHIHNALTITLFSVPRDYERREDLVMCGEARLHTINRVNATSFDFEDIAYDISEEFHATLESARGQCYSIENAKGIAYLEDFKIYTQDEMYSASMKLFEGSVDYLESLNLAEALFLSNNVFKVMKRGGKLNNFIANRPNCATKWQIPLVYPMQKKSNMYRVDEAI